MGCTAGRLSRWNAVRAGPGTVESTVLTNVAVAAPDTPRAPFVLAIAAVRAAGVPITAEAEELVVRLFHAEGRSLVRLARLFVDDRDAAEDIVQEAFLRLARHAHRIESSDRAPAYLRSITLNLARDHNRRGLVSLRHRAAGGREVDVEEDTADRLVRSDDHRRVLEAVRALPRRQRDCITLRYFEEMTVDQTAAALGLSTNSVKTHLQRAMASLGRMVGTP
jgi:RNA polymerase sigma factor (sigma-70 family)